MTEFKKLKVHCFFVDHIGDLKDKLESIIQEKNNCILVDWKIQSVNEVIRTRHYVTIFYTDYNT